MEELHKACKHSLPHPGTTILAWPLKDCCKGQLVLPELQTCKKKYFKVKY